MITGPDTTTPLRRWLETMAISTLVPLASHELRPSDPFWLDGSQPWLMLLPFLSGAQSGVAHGLMSAAVVSGMAFTHELTLGHGSHPLLASWSIGCFIVGALAGQFRDVGERRRAALREQAAQLSESLQRAQRMATTLQLSHARLEERLAASRWSLAGVLEAAQRRMQELTSERALGEVVLEVLASQAMVQSASLFWSASGALLPAPLARLGSKRSASQLHPLTLRAFRSGRLAAVGERARARRDHDADVLAAVPLLTSNGAIVGVVAVHELPFMAFQAEHLRSLLVIAGQLADAMHDRVQALVTPRDPARKSLPLSVPDPIGVAPSAAVSGMRSVGDVARVFENPQ